MTQTSDGHRTSTATVPPHWLIVLQAAENERDVVMIAKDYLATWSPLEISRLPLSCRPGRINDGADVVYLAFTLAQEHVSFRGGLTDGLVIDRMMTFFTHASDRLARIFAVSKEGEPEKQ